MAVPPKYYLDELVALKGAPKVTYPQGGYTFPRIERVYGVPKGRVYDQPTTLTDFPGSLLVQVAELKRDQQDVQIYLRYDTLPGPIIVEESSDPDTGFPTLIAKQQRSVADVFTAGEFVPSAINISSATAGANTVVTVAVNHYLPPMCWVTIAGTGTALDGTQQIRAVPAENQLQFAVTLGSALGASGTVQAINRIVRELLPTSNMLIKMKVDSMIALPDVTVKNENVACFKDHSFPDYAIAIKAYGDAGTAISGGASEYSLSVSGGGTFGLQIQAGYRGLVPAQRLRLFSMGPPAAGVFASYQPTVIMPSEGTIAIKSGTLSTSASTSGTSNARSSSFKCGTIPPVLTGPHPFLEGGGGIGGGALGEVAWFLDLPVSNPPSFNLGDIIVEVDQPQKLRLGLWQTYVWLKTVIYASGCPTPPPGSGQMGADFTYTFNPAVYPTGSAIPTNSVKGLSGSGSSFAISPALPSGLSLDASTGDITGTPVTPSGAATILYTVTCTVSAVTKTGYLLISLYGP